MRLFSRVSAALLFCALSQLTHAQTYNPKAIRIDAPSTVDTAEVLRIVALPTGAALTKEQIETALQRLADTGLFSAVSYTVNPDALTIKLTPSASSQLKPAHFANFVWWQPAELETLIEARVPAYHGQLPLAGTLTDQVAAALVSLLKTKGINDAIVEPLQAGNSLNAVTLSITHPSILIDQVNLEGSLPALAHQVKSFADSLHTQDFDIDEATLTIHESITDIYQKAGYLDAAVTAPTVSAPHQDLLNYAVDLTATIQPGNLYTISTITIPPVPPISSNDLEKAANLHTGDIASSSALRLASAELRKAYSDEGYLDANTSVALSKDIAAHTIAYTFTITPGEVYHLASIDTSALTPQQQQYFVRSLHPAPSTIVNQQLLTAIRQTLGQFHFTSGGLMIKSDRASHTATIVLRLPPSTHH